jgi:hypothetical protein
MVVSTFGSDDDGANGGNEKGGPRAAFSFTSADADGYSMIWTTRCVRGSTRTVRLFTTV